MKEFEAIFNGPITPDKWARLGSILRLPAVVAGKGLLVSDAGSGRIVSAVRPLPPAPPNQDRFGFGGIFLDGGTWRVRIFPGCVHYNEIQILPPSVFKSEAAPAHKFVEAVYPMIDDVPIDAPSKPALALGSRAAATVWLIVATERCYSGLDKTRLLITNRGEKPELPVMKDAAGDPTGKTETAVRVVDFDVTDVGGGRKIADNVRAYVHDNWEQPFACHFTPGSSDIYDSSGPWADSGSSGSSGIDPLPNSSGSSGSDGGDGGGECEIALTADWDNSQQCFQGDGPVGMETASPFRFRLKVRVWFKAPFGHRVCQGYVVGVSCQGGKVVTSAQDEIDDTETEFRWKNMNSKTLEFDVEHPPACGSLLLTWRVRMLAPALENYFHTTTDHGCCDKLIQGTTTVKYTVFNSTERSTTLPPICGSTCSALE